MANEVAERKPANPVVAFKDVVDKRVAQLKFVLPPHISTDKFIRVMLTALQMSPDLQGCSQQSLWNALLRAAQDGLLPDGREAAIVPYASGRKDQAQYIPMIGGLRKLVMQSDVLRDWNVQVVQEGDQFEYELGDNPFIRHKPNSTGGRTRKVLFAYSIATYPDGTKSREVMNADQIEDIRKLSKAQKGPWSNPVFYPEMARKTVARLHAKQLPKSTDLDAVFRREDEDFARAQAQERIEETAQRRAPSVAATLDAFAQDGGLEDDTPAIDESASEVSADGEAGADVDVSRASAPASGPKTPQAYFEYAETMINRMRETEGDTACKTWFTGPEQRKMRSAIGIEIDAVSSFFKRVLP